MGKPESFAMKEGNHKINKIESPTLFHSSESCYLLQSSEPGT